MRSSWIRIPSLLLVIALSLTWGAAAGVCGQVPPEQHQHHQPTHHHGGTTELPPDHHCALMMSCASLAVPANLYTFAISTNMLMVAKRPLHTYAAPFLNHEAPPPKHAA